MRDGYADMRGDSSKMLMRWQGVDVDVSRGGSGDEMALRLGKHEGCYRRAEYACENKVRGVS